MPQQPCLRFLEKNQRTNSEQFQEKSIPNLVQFGFRPKFSTTDALVFATENIIQEVGKKTFVTATFLDLLKGGI